MNRPLDSLLRGSWASKVGAGTGFVLKALGYWDLSETYDEGAVTYYPEQ